MMHYVYPDTAIEYEPREAIPAEAFLNLIREKNKTYIEFIPEDGIFMGKQVRLEQITANALKKRALH